MTGLRVGVVGGGTMGLGIARCLARAGCDVVLQSRRPELRERFLGAVARQARRRSTRQLPSGRSPGTGVGAARATASYEGFHDRQLVVEAVAEDLALKRAQVRQLERVCPAHTVLCSTTSSFTVNELSAGATSPGRLVGTHFLYPVEFTPIVEVVRGAHTTAESAALAERAVATMGKRPLAVADGCGFLVNRWIIPVLLEGLRMYVEHAATPAQLDAAWTRAGGLVGPAVALDLSGLDVALAVVRSFAARRGPAFTPPPLLERLVAAGRLGRKAGHGIFAWHDGRPQHDPALDELRRASELEHGAAQRSRFAFERLTVTVLNEALACLAEHVADERTIDLALEGSIDLPELRLHRLHGAGGLARHLATCDALAGEFGSRFAVRPDIIERIGRGGLGSVRTEE